MKIGEASGFVSSPVYSSVSGTVMRIEDRTMLNAKLPNALLLKMILRTNVLKVSVFQEK